MSILDIFEGDAFNMRSLTLAIDKLPYKPSRLQRLGIFEQRPQTGLWVTIEDRQGILSLLPVQPRGTYPMTSKGAKHRKLYSFQIPHVPQTDAVYAADLMGRRSFGTETETEVFASIVNERLADLKQNHEVTQEYHRVGAINGIVLDADGSTQIANYFTDWGVTQTTVNLDFTDSGTPGSPNYVVDMKVFCQAVTRTMQKALGATTFNGIHAFCGNKFWDAFITHGSVRRAYEFRQTGNKSDLLSTIQIPDGMDNDATFEFGTIDWENYRGFVGTVPFFPDTGAVIIPKGVKGLFLECPGPADFIETVNTPGRPIYVKQERMKFDMGIELYTESNVLYLCTRPAALISVTGINIPTTEFANLVS